MAGGPFPLPFDMNRSVKVEYKRESLNYQKVLPKDNVSPDVNGSPDTLSTTRLRMGKHIEDAPERIWVIFNVTNISTRRDETGKPKTYGDYTVVSWSETK